MTVRNLKDGSKKPWLCECYPNGRNNKRVRKRFATKGEASSYELFLMRDIEDKPWLAQKSDNRRLSKLVEIWYLHYGRTLEKGDAITQKFHHMVQAMGDPVASTLTAKMYSDFRSKRMAGELIFVDQRWNRGKPSISTLNYELGRFKAVFNKLIELGEWKLPNPIENVKPFKESEHEMAFLTHEQIVKLLTYAKHHKQTDMIKTIKLCLATGARWNEAAQLKGSQLSQFKVTFTKTKTKKNRTVPISEELYKEIYKPTSDRLFEECYTPFCYILKNKLGASIPKGQASRILRHTFASHFMMNGGNILVLRDVLGHADIKMTMRYAHFAPDHLTDAITLNPLNNV
ncbi:phage integrase [Vibrio owensii]|uniref:phage integrase n=1 Tax=Vibrio owensii TaxID=696485 RepID=UPI0018F26119|nr:tyrosine-type recombinase/integrase [Vibrio owensii]